VVLPDAPSSVDLLARVTERPESERSPSSEWRLNGAGAQILADLGLRHLRVLGTPRKQVALAGYGLDVVEYVPGRPASA
jgi:3,4-dihydroxy 2-butanone 4-phosphate synthase/GTP cyclohydrolase II